MTSFWKWIVVVLFIVGALAGTAYMSPVYTFTFIPVICLGAILVGHPRVYIYLYLSVAAIYPLIQSITAFAPFQYLNEAMAVILYAIFFGHLVFRRIDLVGVEKFARLCFTLLGYCLLVWLINRSILRGFAQFIFIYLPFIPLFFLVREYFTDRDFDKLLKWTIGFFWINFVLNLGWWFRVNPLPNYQLEINNMVDHAIGTMGGCNHMAYFCCMLTFLLVAVLIKSSIVTKRRKTVIVVTLGALAVQLYLTFTNHAYAFFVLALIPFAYMTQLWKKWYLVAGLIVAGFLFFIFAAQSDWASHAVSKKDLQYRYESLTDSAKMQLYHDLLVKNLKEHPDEWLIGVGPGNGMGNIGMDNRTPFALRMLLEYYAAANTLEMQMTSVTGNTYAVIFSIWGDLGLIGFVLFTAMHISAVTHCSRKTRTGDRKERVVAQFLIASFIFWAILGLVYDPLTTILPIWLWMWFGWLMRKNRTPPVEDNSMPALDTEAGA